LEQAKAIAIDGHCPIAISAFNWMSFGGEKDKLQTFSGDVF
jgi:hypothetical protein